MTATPITVADAKPIQPGQQRPGSRRDDSMINSGVRRTVTTFVALVLCTLPLCALFTDLGWLADLWLAIIVVLAPALLIRLWREPGPLQVWPGVALLVPVLTMRFLPAHATLGFIPSLATGDDLTALVTSLHHSIQDQSVPLHSTMAIRLTVCVLTGLLAALTDLLAVVGHRPALAGLPVMAIYTCCGALSRHAVSWVWFSCAAAGFLVLLAADSRSQVTRWGHAVPRPNERAASVGRTLPAQWIGAVAIVLALVGAVALPAHSRWWGARHSGSSSSGTGASLNPFAALKGQLQRGAPLDLASITVSSSMPVKPFYLRQMVLGTYTGAGWIQTPNGAGEPLSTTNFDSQPPAEGLASTVQFDAQVTVTGLAGNPPVFATPTSVSGLSDTAQWAPTTEVVAGAGLAPGARFKMSITQSEPTMSELENSPSIDGNGNLSRWLQLPAIAPQVRAVLTQLIANVSGEYATARAINNFFTDPANGFTYSLSTVIGDSGSDLVDFLNNRQGYCQQYAAAMGVLLRMAGIPARLVLGYGHPVPDRAGHFTVTTDDAHAWVEAYFPTIGWVPFDPTPLAGITDGSRNDLTWAPHPQSTTQTTPPPTGKKSAPVSAHNSPHASTTLPNTAAKPDAAVSSHSILIALLVLSVIAAAAVGAPAAIRSWRRRSRLASLRSGNTDALWAELADTAVDLGYDWSAARTPRQVATWLAVPVPAAVGPLRTLVYAVEQARYADNGVSDVNARQAEDLQLAENLRAVRKALAAQRSRTQRIRSRLFPASVAKWSDP